MSESFFDPPVTRSTPPQAQKAQGGGFFDSNSNQTEVQAQAQPQTTEQKGGFFDESQKSVEETQSHSFWGDSVFGPIAKESAEIPRALGRAYLRNPEGDTQEIASRYLGSFVEDPIKTASSFGLDPIFTAKLLFGGEEEKAKGNQIIASATQGLQDFKDEHPNWEPQKVDKWYQYFTTVHGAESATAHVAGSIPMLAGQLGLESLGPVGKYVAVSTTYAITSEQTMEQLEQAGVPKDRALSYARMSGVIAAGLQSIPVSKIIGRVTGGTDYLAKAAAQKAIDSAIANGIDKADTEALNAIAIKSVVKTIGENASADDIKRILTQESLKKVVAKSAVEMAAFNVAGGSTQDVLTASAERKPINWDDFWSNRVSDAITGLGTGAITSGPLKILSDAHADYLKSQRDQLLQPKVEEDANSQLDFQTSIKKMFGDTPQTQAGLDVFHSQISRIAEAQGVPIQRAYAKWIEINGIGKDLGVDQMVLNQDPGAVNGFFLKSSQLINSDEFAEGMGKGGQPSDQVLSRLKNSGISPEELRWTGLGQVLTDNGKKRVTVEELQNHLDQNQVRLNSILLTNQGNPELSSKLQGITSQHTKVTAAYNDALQQREIWKDRVLVLTDDPEKQARAQQKLDKIRAQIPDLVQEMNNLGAQRKELNEQLSSSKTRFGGYFASEQNKGATNYQERLLQLPTDQGTSFSGVGETRVFSDSVQWSDIPNIVVNSLSYNHTTTDSEGNQAPAFHIAELQNTLGDAGDAGDAGNAVHAPFIERTKDWVKLGVKQSLLAALGESADFLTLPNGKERSEKWNGAKLEAIYKTVEEEMDKEVGRLDPQAKKDYVTADSTSPRNTILPEPLHPRYELTPKLKQALAQRGFSLFQNQPSYDKLLSLTPNEGDGVKAIKAKDGTIYIIQNTSSHMAGVSRLKLLPSQVESTGFVGNVGNNEVRYIGSGKGTGHNIDYLRHYDGKIVVYDGNQDSVKLFSQARGSLSLLDNGKFLVQALHNPNFETGVHELIGHLGMMLDPEHLEKLKDWAQGGKVDPSEELWKGWSREGLEKVANGMVAYLREGNSPTPELQPQFDLMKSELTSLYQDIKGTHLDVGMNPEVRGILDQSIAKDSPETAKARELSDQAKKELQTWVEEHQALQGLLKQKLEVKEPEYLKPPEEAQSTFFEPSIQGTRPKTPIENLQSSVNQAEISVHNAEQKYIGKPCGL